MEQIGLTSIANAALVLLGSAERIASVNDGGSTAVQCKDILPILIPDLLSEHPWNFAVTRREVPRENLEAAKGEWAWRYQLPSDCLRWLPWGRDDQEYFEAVEERGRLLAHDEGPVIIRYIADVRDPMAWSASFRGLLTATLAYHLASSVADSLGQQDRLEAKAEKAIRRARRLDGLASPVGERLSPAKSSRAVRAMRGGGGGDPARWHC